MEATLIFTLSNQFLVQVVKKLPAQSDLDLILTEYYKDKLESQLKNKKTHMKKEHLTEFTILSLSTHLLVLSN